MARRHATQADFQLVGMSKDPTPGDPQLIQGVLQRYSDVGDAAEKALNVLKKDGAVSTGRGSAMEELRKKIGDDLPDKLTKTATSYHDAASAYRDYIPRLQEAQDTLDRAVEQAQSAAPQANQVPPTLAPDATDADKAAAAKAQDVIDAGKSQLSAAKSLAEQAQSMRQTAQRTCADVLDRAASEAIPERNVFQKISDFFKDFPFVQILLGLLIAVVSVFFPVAGLLLGGALLAITQIAAIASGNFKLGDLLVGLIGLVPGGSVLKLGGGLIKAGAGAVSKLAPAAAKTVKGSITGIKSSINSSKTIGPLANSGAGKFAGGAVKGFGEEAGNEAATEALNGDRLDAGAILGAGALGAVGGGLAGRKGGAGGSGPAAQPAGARAGGSRGLDGGAAPQSAPATSSRPPSPNPARPSAQLDGSVDPHHVTGVRPSVENPSGRTQFRVDNNRLFRDDTRLPIAAGGQPGIFNVGFAPRDSSNIDLRNHVDGEHSAFVATTRRQDLNFLGPPKGDDGRVFRFHIEAPGGIDVNATLGKHRDANQQEVAFPGGIRPENIAGVEQVTSGTAPFFPVRTGEFRANPNFKPTAPNSHFPTSPADALPPPRPRPLPIRPGPQPHLIFPPPSPPPPEN